jgi:hypothetical protein
MPEELVTAAVFGDFTQAEAVRLLLNAEGVPAFFANETMAGSLFVVAAAVGGIKLEVPASRLTDSLRIFDEQMPSEAGNAEWTDVDVGRPDDAEQKGSSQQVVPLPAESESPSRRLTIREQRADRLLRGTLFGFFCFPVLLLTFWRLVQVFVSDERLDPQYRRKAQWAGILIVPLTFLALRGYRMLIFGSF